VISKFALQTRDEGISERFAPVKTRALFPSRSDKTRSHAFAFAVRDERAHLTLNGRRELHSHVTLFFSQRAGEERAGLITREDSRRN